MTLTASAIVCGCVCVSVGPGRNLLLHTRQLVVRVVCACVVRMLVVVGVVR